MAILIVSDIHGNAEGIGLVKKAIGALRADGTLSNLSNEFFGIDITSEQ